MDQYSGASRDSQGLEFICVIFCYARDLPGIEDRVECVKNNDGRAKKQHLETVGVPMIGTNEKARPHEVDDRTDRTTLQ